MFCEKCGNQLPDKAQFCAKCGTRVKEGKVENKADKNIVNRTSPKYGRSANKKTDDVIKDMNLGKRVENVKKAIDTIWKRIIQWIKDYRMTWKEWKGLKRKEQYLWFGIHAGAAVLFLCIVLIMNHDVVDSNTAPVVAENSEVEDETVIDDTSENGSILTDNNEEMVEIDKPVLSVKGECISGNICVFGSYQLDDQEGAEPIEWIILTEKNNKIFVLSRYILREQLVFGDNTSQGKLLGIAWEKSSLRKWLNNSFYNEAFTQEQKNAICTTTLGVEYTGTIHGECQDKVFCLGVSEAETYKDFLKATFYGSENSFEWWLGSLSPDLSTTKLYTPYVDRDGNINRRGYLNSVPLAARPAMWINLDEVSIIEVQ